MKSHHLPQKVKLVEVGPRDGLQNESRVIPTEVKCDFIDKLSQTGLSVIEITSFVSPKWIPQLADSADVLSHVKKQSSRYARIHTPVLVPNKIGFENAFNAGAKEIAIFTAASETFNQKNTHCSLEESLNRCAEVLQLAKKHNIPVRGYISCVLGCPYEGYVPFEKTAEIAQTLYQLGCYEISLGDTIGVGTPSKAQKLIELVSKKIPIEIIAGHFHDTYGQALANIFAVLQQGVSIFDSSVNGLGGCPYARGATGNVATEDLLYMMNGLEIETGVDMKKLLAAGKFISGYLNRPSRSKLGAIPEK